MRHVKRSKLTLDRDTIRQLGDPHLAQARGGVGPSVAPNATCSQCFVGCHTGDAC